MLAIFIAVVCLLVTSPIVDLRKISVADQISRLEAGEVSIDDFDYEYLRFNTGRPGYEALVSLKKHESIANNKENNSLYIFIKRNKHTIPITTVISIIKHKTIDIFLFLSSSIIYHSSIQLIMGYDFQVPSV